MTESVDLKGLDKTRERIADYDARIAADTQGNASSEAWCKWVARKYLKTCALPPDPLTARCVSEEDSR